MSKDAGQDDEIVIPSAGKSRVYDRELLVSCTAVKRFRQDVEGWEFVIYTVHKHIIYALNQKLDKWSVSLLFHLAYVGQLATDIRCIKVIDNNVAYALSRIEAVGKTVHPEPLAAAKGNDNELREIINTGSCALRFRIVPFPEQKVGTYWDISSEILRPNV